MVAGYAASHFRKASPGLLLGVVLAYQLVGTLGEWATKGDSWLAAQDFRIGIPGMLLQISGAGYSLTASFVSNTIPIDF